MRKFKLVALAFLLTISSSLRSAAAKQDSEPKFKLIEFHMALLKRGPNWDSATTPEGQKIQAAHMDYFRNLVETGRAVLGGPLSDDSDIRGIYVLRATTTDRDVAAKEARALAEADPAVKAGHLIAEMHPWWSEEVMKKASSPIKLSTAYLAFLSRGANATSERTPETEALQKAHLENINKLAQMKKLVVAGPFGDRGQLRGIFVFKVASLEEAKTLAATDPAVQAGRLAVDVHPWLVPDGMLP